MNENLHTNEEIDALIWNSMTKHSCPAYEYVVSAADAREFE